MLVGETYSAPAFCTDSIPSHCFSVGAKGCFSNVLRPRCLKLLAPKIFYSKTSLFWYSDSSLTGFHPCPYSAFLMEGVGMPLPLEQSSWWNYVSPFSSYKFCYNKWAWLGANKALSTRTGLGQTWSVGSRVSSCWHIKDYRGTFLAGPPLFPHTAPDILPAIYWMPSSHWETFHWGISLQSCFLEGPGSFRHLTLTEA